LRKLQRQTARRTARRRNFLYNEGGADRDRKLAGPLQYGASALIAGISTASTRSTRLAGHKTGGAHASSKLRSQILPAVGAAIEYSQATSVARLRLYRSGLPLVLSSSGNSVAQHFGTFATQSARPDVVIAAFPYRPDQRPWCSGATTSCSNPSKSSRLSRSSIPKSCGRNCDCRFSRRISPKISRLILGRKICRLARFQNSTNLVEFSGSLYKLGP
jgi:hypothetical protein